MKLTVKQARGKDWLITKKISWVGLFRVCSKSTPPRRERQLYTTLEPPILLILHCTYPPSIELSSSVFPPRPALLRTPKQPPNNILNIPSHHHPPITFLLTHSTQKQPPRRKRLPKATSLSNTNKASTSSPGSLGHTFGSYSHVAAHSSSKNWSKSAEGVMRKPFIVLSSRGQYSVRRFAVAVAVAGCWERVDMLNHVC
jgi:hypothetical protein